VFWATFSIYKYTCINCDKNWVGLHIGLFLKSHFATNVSFRSHLQVDVGRLDLFDGVLQARDVGGQLLCTEKKVIS
jgi:hypothetical protein